MVKEVKEKPKEKEEDRYTDSSTFLKGTNSQNPHNDYCQNFIDTGQVSFIIIIIKSGTIDLVAPSDFSPKDFRIVANRIF